MSAGVDGIFTNRAAELLKFYKVVVHVQDLLNDQERRVKAQWSGRLWLGRDYGLIVGELGRTAPHAHYAHQLMCSPGVPITVSLDGQVTTARRLFIPSRQTHAILDSEGEVTVLCAEPAVFDIAPLLHQDLFLEALRQLPRRGSAISRLERALAALDQQLSGSVSAGLGPGRAFVVEPAGTPVQPSTGFTGAPPGAVAPVARRPAIGTRRQHADRRGPRRGLCRFGSLFRGQ